MEMAPVQPSLATSSSQRRLVAPLSRVARSVPCVSADDIEPAAAAQVIGTELAAAAADCGICTTTETTATTTPVVPPWSDLPGDLLAAVCTMVPTTLDRIRLAAVCGPWRAALVSRRRHPAPPALPWLLYSPRRVHGTGVARLLYNPEDGGATMRVSLPSVTADSRLLGAHDGGWVATFEERRRRLAITNLFSGAKARLSTNQKRLVYVIRRHTNSLLGSIRKLVFSEAPTTSRGCILAAITTYRQVALCRIGCVKGKWEMAPCPDGEGMISDIAFCNGELYGLIVNGFNGTEELIRYEVSDQGPPVVTAARRLSFERRSGAASSMDDLGAYVSYIFEMHGMPAMAVHARWPGHHEPSFRAFELVGNQNKWVEVISLGNYVLFVGPNTPCRMIHISPGRHSGVEANRVYYLNHTFPASDHDYALCMNANGVRSLYNSDKGVDGDGATRRIMSVGYYVADHRTATWILPPNL